MLYSSSCGRTQKNSPTDIKLEKKRGVQGSATGAGAELPLQLVAKQVVPLKPYTGEDVHTAAQGGPHATAGGHVLKEAAACEEPMHEQAPGKKEARAGAGFLAGPVAHGEELTLEQFLKERILWEGPMLEQRKSVRRKEEQKGTVVPLCCLGPGRGDKRVGNEGVKLNLGKRGWGEGVFSFVFVSHHPTVFLIDNKGN
ncbi:hypothetical protein llap_1820 [Limosa lapponica baueri]|uniref:Uncharacterized protein n=1 Tax=Limosa lapponica baueri TaxID=1758121 RepID=A0A2I0UPE1_LIMLA|nr:hypothetical protein llap_1820 [Limosa lapponica baueri]